MKFDSTLTSSVRKCLDANLVPMLLGEPGIGKSSWLMSLAEQMHTQCFVLACNQLADKADLTGARGVPVLDAKGQPTGKYKQIFYPHAVVADAIEYANSHKRETPILFLDELNRTTPDVTSELLSIPTLRRIGDNEPEHQIPPNLRIVIAGNDKGNITALDEASVSRFVLIHVAPDAETYIAVNPDINPFVKNVLLAHPDAIFGKTIIEAIGNTSDEDKEDDNVSIEEIIDDGETMAQFATPRTITAASKLLNTYTNQELLELLHDIHSIDGEEKSSLQELLEGVCGHTQFTLFLLAEISSGVMNTNNQSAVNTAPGKPQCYDEFKSQPDMTSLNTFIETMSDNDKSGCLVYLLYEQEDNGSFISALAPTITQLMNNDLKMIMRLSSGNQLDVDNVKALLDSNTAIANTLSIMLETAVS